MNELINFLYIIKQHGLMLIDKVWQWIRMFFDWIMGLFVVSGNYDFINIFSNLILIIFSIGLIVFILSYIFKGKSWLKYIVGANVYNSPLRFLIKAGVFVIGFGAIYFVVTNSIGKILSSVSVVKEDGFIVDMNHEGYKEDSQPGKKLKSLSSFLSDIKYPGISTSGEGGESDDSQLKNMDVVLYKEVKLNNTKIAFSPIKRSGTNAQSLNYKNITISLDQADSGEIIYGNGTLYFYQLGDFLRKAKEYSRNKNICSENEKAINITNLGSDVYSSLVQYDESIKEDKKILDQLYITTNKITEIFNKSQDHYLITTKDNIDDILGETDANLSFSESRYKRLAKEILCLPEKSTNKEDGKKVEKQEGETSENKQQPKGTLNVKSGIHQAQIDKANSILEALLFLRKFSMNDVKEVKEPENKFLFLSAILDTTLKANTPTGGLKYSLEGADADDYYTMMKVSQNEYNALSIPFVIDLENGDTIINYGMCSYFVFDQTLERTLRSLGLQHMLSYLANNCGQSFGWLYDYRNNDIDKLGKESYKKSLTLLKSGKLVDSSSNALTTTSDDAYIKYGFYQRGSDKAFQNTYSYTTKTGEDMVGEAFSETYVSQVDKFSWLVGFLNVYKVIVFSIFLYILPGVILAYLLKIIRF